MIQATDYTDPLIDSIRQTVASKDDQIPFLLLPIKIETRFMKVEKPLYNYGDSYPQVLEGLYATEELLDSSLKLEGGELLNVLSTVHDSLDKSCCGVETIQQISNTEKQGLLVNLTTIERKYEQLSRNVSKSYQNDTTIAAEAFTYRRGISNNLLQMKQNLTTLSVSENFSNQEGKEVVNQLSELKGSLQKISVLDVTASDRKTKRILFEQIDGELNHIAKTVKDGRKLIKSNIQADQSQLDELNVLQESFTDMLDEVSQNMGTIDSEYKKTEYKNRIETTKQLIGTLNKEIEEVFKPKIQLKLDLNTITGREILKQINTIRFSLKTQNKKAFQSYNQIRDDRTALYEELHALRANTHCLGSNGSRNREFYSTSKGI